MNCKFKISLVLSLALCWNALGGSTQQSSLSPTLREGYVRAELSVEATSQIKTVFEKYIEILASGRQSEMREIFTKAGQKRFGAGFFQDAPEGMPRYQGAQLKEFDIIQNKGKNYLVNFRIYLTNGKIEASEISWFVIQQDPNKEYKIDRLMHDFSPYQEKKEAE